MGFPLSDDEILFRRLKDVCMRSPVQSKRYKAWVMQEHPGKTFHHIFGSLGSLKSSGYMGVAVPFKEHSDNQDERRWLIEQLPQALDNLLRYVKELEDEL